MRAAAIVITIREYFLRRPKWLVACVPSVAIPVALGCIVSWRLAQCAWNVANNK